MKTRAAILALMLTLGAGVQQASAGVVGVDLGTGAPPPALGGYTMTPFDPGSVGGATPLTVGSGWATWGQGYTGTVYFSGFSNDTVTLTLSGAHAVYFYEEPNQFSNFSMTATDSSGTSVTTIINGYYGSAGVGFYTTAGEYLSSIVVTATDPDGFAIGEFGIDSGSLTGTIGTVPDSASTLTLLGGVMLALVGLRRRLA